MKYSIIIDGHAFFTDSKEAVLSLRDAMLSTTSFSVFVFEGGQYVPAPFNDFYRDKQSNEEGPLSCNSPVMQLRKCRVCGGEIKVGHQYYTCQIRRNDRKQYRHTTCFLDIAPPAGQAGAMGVTNGRVLRDARGLGG